MLQCSLTGGFKGSPDLSFASGSTIHVLGWNVLRVHLLG